MYEILAQMFGYGQPTARMWLVGLEEHCNGEADILERIAIRQAQPVELFDVVAFHGQLTQGMPAIDGVSVWQIASAIYQGVYGQPTELGRLHPAVSDLLLAEILPFPRPQHHLWPPVYQAAFPTRQEYVAAALPGMSARLREMAMNHRPEVVMLHGKGAHDQWLRLPAHREMNTGWEQIGYGERRNETFKWRLHGGTLWLRTNNLVNNGHIRWQAPQIDAVVNLIQQHRIPASDHFVSLIVARRNNDRNNTRRPRSREAGALSKFDSSRRSHCQRAPPWPSHDLSIPICSCR